MAARQTSYKYIERVPGVVGGEPKIKGTRVPVWIIVNYVRLGGSLDQFAGAYPHVSREAAE
jgi:uncharacterized protein (DUF433 family)